MERIFNFNGFKEFFCISILLFSFSNIQAQNEKPEYSNPEITLDDMSAILQTLNMDLFKFGVNLPEDNNYKVCLYLEEYAEKEIINEKTIWCTSSPYTIYDNEERALQPFDGARFIIKNDENIFLLNIRMGDFVHPQYKIEIDSIYPYKHLPKRFKISNTTLSEGKTPLVMIGSFWESELPDGQTLPDGSNKILRFCMENELSPDFSSEAFNEMPHHYIIGLNVTKQNEYQ